MKIAHKIIILNVLHILFLALALALGYEGINYSIERIRYEEIADKFDDLMRQIESKESTFENRNEENALYELRNEIDKGLNFITDKRNDIIPLIGLSNFEKLQYALYTYRKALKINGTISHSSDKKNLVRRASKNLRETFFSIKRIERVKTFRMLKLSKIVMVLLFLVIVAAAITISFYFLKKVIGSIHKIEKEAMRISEGHLEPNFESLPDDEVGTVMKAFQYMCEQLKIKQEQMVQKKKLESLGTITAGVAHELGNPLNNISMIAQGFDELYEKLSDEERRNYMREIYSETERIKDIVSDLLEFSRPKEADFRFLSINEVIMKGVKLVQNMMEISNIHVQLHLQEDLPPVYIDEHDIQGVLVNLLTNAVQAMPSGGILTICTRLLPDTMWVETEVTDTGHGIPPEVLPHIFDPFFTTKGANGIGLGLAVSYGIIRNHKGEMEVRSEVGAGTTFLIRLPARPAGDASPHPSEAAGS